MVDGLSDGIGVVLEILNAKMVFKNTLLKHIMEGFVLMTVTTKLLLVKLWASVSIDL